MNPHEPTTTVTPARLEPLVTPAGIALPENRWNLLDGLTPAVPPLVSVIVVHYDQHCELERTLGALAHQTHPAERLEIIVVDDGSPTPPQVPAGVRLVTQPDRGFRLSAARNAGAAIALGEVFCFLDADTAPEPSFISELTRLPALAPDVVTVGRRRHADLGSVPLTSPIDEAAPVHELSPPQWLLQAYEQTSDLLVSDDRSYRFLIGAVLACHRRIYEATGGFDESFTEYGGEDWEWAHRAWQQGALFAHVPTAVAWHDGPEWSARTPIDAQRTKNVETRRLMSRIGVDGSAPRALLTERPDTVVIIRDAPTLTALLVCVDTVLEVLPRALVMVPADFADAAEFSADPRVRPDSNDPGIRHARVVVEVARTLGFAGSELRSSVDRLLDDQLASIDLSDERGAIVATVISQRARRRAERWGDQTLFASATMTVPVPRSDDEPSLAAHLGRW